MLEALTGAIVHSGALMNGGGEVKILKVITEPFTKLVIQVSISIYLLFRLEPIFTCYSG